MLRPGSLVHMSSSHLHGVRELATVRVRTMAIGEAEAAALTATDAVAALRSGELDLREYVEALLRRTERLAHLGAYVTHDPDRVLGGLRADGPLRGLPVGVKDSIGTADMPTGAGTPGLDGWTVPDLIDPDDVSVVIGKARSL